MRLIATPLFWEQQERYDLKYTCEACAHFAAGTGKCSLGWPNREHLTEWYRRRPERVVFCKDFELR